jgi:hypothetical protein
VFLPAINTFSPLTFALIVLTSGNRTAGSGRKTHGDRMRAFVCVCVGGRECVGEWVSGCVLSTLMVWYGRTGDGMQRVAG